MGITTQTVYRVLENEQPPAQETRHRPHHITDPYLPYLTRRWNEGCHTARELYQEMVAEAIYRDVTDD
jgi:transposase